MAKNALICNLTQTLMPTPFANQLVALCPFQAGSWLVAFHLKMFEFCACVEQVHRVQCVTVEPCSLGHVSRLVHVISTELCPRCECRSSRHLVFLWRHTPAAFFCIFIPFLRSFGMPLPVASCLLMRYIASTLSLLRGCEELDSQVFVLLHSPARSSVSATPRHCLHTLMALFFPAPRRCESKRMVSE